MNFPNAIPQAAELSQYLNKEVKVELDIEQGGVQYLFFDGRTGRYLLGAEEEDVTGQTIIVDTASMLHGWVIWYNRKPEKVFKSVFENEPPRPNDINGNAPNRARAFKAVLGSDNDVSISFETSSMGGRKGVDMLLNQIRARSLSGEKDTLYPVVQLSSSSYFSSKRGSTIHNCLFKIISWVDRSGSMIGKKNKETVDTADQVEEVENKDAPVRRRRVLS